MDSISKSKCMVIGISSSGTAHNIVNCLENASNKGMKSLMISGRESPEVINEKYNSVQIGTDFYHTGEVVSLMLMYQLIHGSGGVCPSISKKLNATSFDRLVKNTNIKQQKQSNSNYLSRRPIQNATETVDIEPLDEKNLVKDKKKSENIEIDDPW